MLLRAQRLLSFLFIFSPRTFNPADYAEPANTDDNYGNNSGNTWNNTGHFEPDDGTSEWLFYSFFVFWNLRK